MEDLSRVWGSSKSLFSYGRIGETFKAELPHSDFRLGLAVFAVAAILTAVLASVSKVEEAHFGVFTYNTVAEIADIGQAVLDTGLLLQFALFQFLFIAPFSMVFSLVYERIAYQIFRLIGGKATFAQQYYLASIIGLAMAISTALGLLVPLPCLGPLAGLAFILITLYFVIFVSSKAYEIAHQLPFVHTLIIVLVLLLPRAIVMSFILIEATALFGLPEYYNISGV